MNEVYLLPEDRISAEQRILELEQLIHELGEDFRDAFTQSSETWHDNSPFEAVRDKQAMYSAELQQLRVLIRMSTLTPPKKKRGCIGIGDTVLLANDTRYKIAGDWTSAAGQKIDGIWQVSRSTPVAVSLIGKRVGDSVVIGKNTTLVKKIGSN